ncbi:MAG: S9 family peptidase [Acidobacteria bacterium]|nr:S9 family peptidase [Acidobacteriota bacterium]
MRCFLSLLTILSLPLQADEPVAVKANYELASRWTPQKIGKMVFDTNVAPRWFENGDRFWYSHETSQGRKFFLVDPVKKSKAPLFDHAKMAASLTSLTRIPYDAQHLPIQNARLVKNDAALMFEVSVPSDAEIPGLPKEAAPPPAATSSPSEKDDEEDQPQQRRAVSAGSRTRLVYFEYGFATAKLEMLPDYKAPRKPRWASLSPDEKTVIYARGENLYMMDDANYQKAIVKEDDASIIEIQLTTDGETDFGYARRLSAEEKRQLNPRIKNPRVPAIAIHWSHDSQKISVVRNDSRKVSDLWVINSLSNPRPTLESYKYAMPGEVNIPQAHLEIFDLAKKARLAVKADQFKDQTIQIYNAPVSYKEREAFRRFAVERTNAEGEQQQGQQGPPPGPSPKWLAAASSKLYFNRTSRDLKRIDVCVADTATGEVKTLIEERLNTYVEVKPLRLLGDGKELIHWSERDGWAHFYLFDADGKLKNQITSGEFHTEDIEVVDEKTRTLVFTANALEKDEDPYYYHTYKVNLDATGLKRLDKGQGTHNASFSDSGKYFVDTYSRVNLEPSSTLNDNTGLQLVDLETTDLSALKQAGFEPPQPFAVKADDGVTDLYGVMYKPFNFDPKKSYPIVAFVYPGPQTESVTKAFNPRSPNITLAQLGFIVIEVGNRGGHPARSKWYHSFGYGNLRDYGLADKKTAIEQLARRHSFIDINRVGITGHSGGGFMSTAALLVYPDFFKVAVSSSGNHENNIYNRWWSEKHHGVKEVKDKDGNIKFEYTIERNSDLAKNLKGRLLLTTGDIDDNVHPGGTLRVADALIKANKRFDFFVFPGKRHGYADAQNYFLWLRADYFAKHLLGDFSQPVSLVELAREQEQSTDKAAARSTN